MAMTTEIEEIFSTDMADGKSGSLGIDREGNLYWNGKQSVTKQRVSLARWINVAIIVGAFSTFILAFVGVVQLIKGW